MTPTARYDASASVSNIGSDTVHGVVESVLMPKQLGTAVPRFWGAYHHTTLTVATMTAIMIVTLHSHHNNSGQHVSTVPTPIAYLPVEGKCAIKLSCHAGSTSMAVPAL